MKNFPHQYNDLRKLRATLETVRALDEAGQDNEDDGVLGYELARRRIYGFCGLDYNGDAATVDARLEARIAEDEQKPAGRQGARTAAREMRRSSAISGGWRMTVRISPQPGKPCSAPLKVLTRSRSSCSRPSRACGSRSRRADLTPRAGASQAHR